LVNTRKYASNISNIILTNIAAVAAVANDTRYSKLDGTNTRTGALKFNNLTQNKVISLYDTGNNFQFVGIGANSGLVSSCFGTSDAFKFNVGLTTTTSKEIMKIASDGSLTVGNSTAATSFTLTDIVGAAWQLITGYYNLSFNNFN
jgi:hypothetical protein